MKIKNFAIGALVAAMLFTGTSVMEAAVYNTSASRLPTKIDSRCGRTEAFLLKNTRFDVKHTMTVNYAKEYVAPCFSRKGIYISDMEAKAIAFAALQMYDVQQNSNGSTVSFSAKGEADSGDGDYWLTTIYDNKKYINAFISTYDELRTENAHSIPASKGYAQYGDSMSAESLQYSNQRIYNLYSKFENMDSYWAPGVKLVLTGDYVNFRTAPSTDSNVIDSLMSGEEIAPLEGTFEAEGRQWWKAINAQGKVGYVSADFVRVAC